MKITQKINKYIIAALVAVFALLAIRFPAGALPHRARADEITLWTLSDNNWIVLPNGDELAATYTRGGPSHPSGTDAFEYGTVTDSTYFSLRNYVTRDDYFLNVKNAYFTTNDDSRNYIFYFVFYQIVSPYTEYIPVSILVSEGSKIDNIAVDTLIPYDLDKIVLRSIQVYRLSNEDRNNISPIPMYERALYTSGTEYTVYTIPQEAILYNEDPDKYFKCDFGVLTCSKYSINNEPNATFTASFSDVEMTVKFALSSFDTLTDDYGFGNVLYEDFTNEDDIYIEVYQEGYKHYYYDEDDTYLWYPIYLSMEPTATTISPKFYNGGDISKFGYADDNNVIASAKGFDAFAVMVSKISATYTPEPEPEPEPDGEENVPIATRVYATAFAGLWTSIAATIVYTVSALVDLVAYPFRGDLDLIPLGDIYDEVVKPVYTWLYNGCVNVVSAVGKFLSNAIPAAVEFVKSAATAVGKFVTETLPRFISNDLLPALGGILQFIGKWWWLLLIAAGIIFAGIIIAKIRND